MRGRLTISLALLGALLAWGPQGHAARTVTNSAGRQVEVPGSDRAGVRGRAARLVLLYVLAPDPLAGWSGRPHPEDLPTSRRNTATCRCSGSLTGRGDDANLEVVLQTKPDLIFDFGSVAPTYVSLAERVQAQTGIPYILIDGRFANTAAGAAPARRDSRGRGAGRADREPTPRSTLRQIDAMLAEVPQEQRPRVYLARGPEGLETGLAAARSTPRSSSGSARSTSPWTRPARRGIVQVSIEQVIVWNPDVVVTWDEQLLRDRSGTIRVAGHGRRAERAGCT